MTDRPIVDDELVTWLHRGSQAAPPGLLGDVVEQVSHTRQDRSPLAQRGSSFHAQLCPCPRRAALSLIPPPGRGGRTRL